MNGVRRFRVRVDGSDHEVEVRSDADGRTFAVVGTHRFEIVPGADGRMLVREPGATMHRTVSLEPGAVPQYAAEGGQSFLVEVLTAQQAALADARHAARRGTGATEVRSPMPGRIVRVLVAEGDVVEADTATVIVEAMKMENEVRTTGPGRIARIAVKVGDTVDAGQVLCELAPHEAS